MSFRTRLLLAFAPVVLIPIAALALIVRSTMNERYVAEFNARIAAVVDGVERDLDAVGGDLRHRIGAIGAAAVDDNRFRLAVAGAGERDYLLDYAERAMALGGLDVLQIQESDGRVLSSGHFRNEFDQRLPVLAHLEAQAPSRIAVAPVQTPDARMLALVVSDSARLGSRWLYLTGGFRAASILDLGSTADDVRVTLTVRDSGDASAPRVVDAVSREIVLPYISGTHMDPTGTTISVIRSLEPLRAVQRRLDGWFLAVFGLAGAAAFGVAALFAAQLSRPLTALANQTRRLDLDNLDVPFDTERRDEIGALTRLLGTMVSRIKTGTSRLREMERRVAVGDMARQVNHDIKNGLIPIRNVFDHLSQVQREHPEGLAAVFGERQETVRSSITYLENLASQYAKLGPVKSSSACDVSDVVRATIESIEVPERCELRSRVDEGLPLVRCDRLALRRIIENLVRNAIDALDGLGGTVTVACTYAEAGSDSVVLRVIDSGHGMREDELERAFEDFYTSKPTGTGLGLSVVRRLVGDMGGAIRIETAPGSGTTVIVELPRHEGGRLS